MSDLDRQIMLSERCRELQDRGIRYVQIETPDLNGTLRGKLVTVEKGLSPDGGAFCTILYGLSVRDDVYESKYSSFANGFPDILALADPDTLVEIDPENSTAAVICDMMGANKQEYYGISPRSVLRRVVNHTSNIGYEARFAVELELFVVHADDAAVVEGRVHDQVPLGRVNNAYSLSRMVEIRALASEFMDYMNDLGIAIEAIHTELGYGMIEIAISHLPALQAADACARVKLYLKEFLAKRGLAAVFMPKWKYEESGCGGHVHQSLWREGLPIFSDDKGLFSSIGYNYIAGLMATLGDFSSIFYPTINAYRRMDALSWAPENISWGMDNRTCALRVITQPNEKAYRIEHRCPGADINPYLAIAAMLSGGIHGVEEKLEPSKAVKGNAGGRADLELLPNTLEKAIDSFDCSSIAGKMLGDDFVSQYTITRRQEWELWHQWQLQTVSEWELNRYFDSF